MVYSQSARHSPSRCCCSIDTSKRDDNDDDDDDNQCGLVIIMLLGCEVCSCRVRVIYPIFLLVCDCRYFNGRPNPDPRAGENARVICMRQLVMTKKKNAILIIGSVVVMGNLMVSRNYYMRSSLSYFR